MINSLLIYNISHYDLILLLKTSANSDTEILAKPKFNKFNLISKHIYNCMDNNKFEIIYYYSKNNCKIPIGVKLLIPSDTDIKWDYFKIRDNQNFNNSSNPYIYSIIFPIISMCIFRWYQRLNCNHDKILFLLSGQGISTNDCDHSISNSTKNTSNIIESYVKKCYNDVKITKLNSNSNIFSYDDNIKFLNNKLKPYLENIRHELSLKYDDKWIQHFNIALTLSGGSFSRITALTKCLRIFKPDMIHISNLKTYWHKYPNINNSELENNFEYYSFYKFDTIPAIFINDVSNDIVTLTDNILSYKKHILKQLKDDRNEIKQFWLRKTKKMVIAVLLCQKDNKCYYSKGINLEVSMPTGSLCAERNAISTMLADNPSISRRNFTMIGVLSINITELKNDLNPINPCGSCREWLKKIAEVNPNFKIINYKSEECLHVYITNIM